MIFTSSPGLLKNSLKTDRELFLLSPTDSAALTDNFAAIEVKMQAIVVIDSLLLSATGQDSLDLLQQRLDAAQFIDSIGLEQDSLLADIQAQRTSASSQVISDNAAITCTEVFEENEQDVNEIFLKTISQGTFIFDSTQVPMLEDIASQCPLTGGSAVFRARGLLALVGDFEYDDENVCDSLNGRSSGGEPMPGQVKFEALTLVPNPATDIVTGYFPEAVTGASISLTDNMGRQRLILELDERRVDQFTLDVRHFNTGIYHCTVRANEGKVFRQTLVIR